MIRATQVRAQHRWTVAPADTVVLDFDDRHRRRMAMTATRGLEFLLDLENAVVLRGGDALVLDDGRLIEVVAAPESLIEIRGTDPQHLVRVAWHLGNRHLPTQIIGKGLRIRRDHVIEAMVRGLGARVIEIEAVLVGGVIDTFDSGQALQQVPHLWQRAWVGHIDMSNLMVRDGKRFRGHGVE